MGTVVRRVRLPAAAEEGEVMRRGGSASLLRGRTMPGLHRPGESLQPRGASYLRLSVWAFNEAALRFYEQLGHGVHSRILGKELPSAV